MGPALFGWLSWALWVRLRSMPDLPVHAGELVAGFSGAGLLRLLAIGGLMAVNWGTEALKWRWLLAPVIPLTYSRALRSVLAGVSLSVATPNRIGEYGGRILYIPEGHRLQAVSLSMMAGLVQLLVTLTAGILAGLLPGERLGAAMAAGIPAGVRTAGLVLTGGLVMLGALLVLRIDHVLRHLSRWPLAGRVTRHLPALSRVSGRRLAAVCGLSVLRYAVFVVQYVLMLRAVQVEVGWLDGSRAVALFFLLMSVVPSIALIELGLRWQYSLLVFGIFSTDVLAICAASTGIWLVNLALPAAAGTLLMLGLRLRTGPPDAEGRR